MAGRFNLEFDARVLRTSIGALGRTKPSVTPNGQLQQVFCISCGKPSGHVTSEIPPALRGDPGVFATCMACANQFGAPPAHAISFERYRQ